MRRRPVVLGLGLGVLLLSPGCGGRERREERREDRHDHPHDGAHHHDAAPAHAAAQGDGRGDAAVGPNERRDDRRDRAVDARSGWDKLGERLVNFGGVDRDMIDVGARDGRFTKVMLVVEHSALEVFDVDLVFGDGDHFSPATRFVFGKGTTTREIDLPGGARVIQKATFRYKNLVGGGRATLELWAK